jgi:hypothetical protein
MMKGSFHAVAASLAAIALVGSTLSVSAMTLVDEDFESYDTTTEMNAIWAGGGAGTLAPTDGYNGTKGMAHPGGTDNVLTLSQTVAPDATTGIRLVGKMHDDNAGNKRMSIGLRTAATFPLFEIGFYNQTNATKYASREASFPGVNPSWNTIGPDPSTTSSVEGWHTFTAEFELNRIYVAVDLSSDGSIDLSETFTPNGSAWSAPFNQIRLGGPSSVSSAGGGTVYDDILLETYSVPEPASIATLVLACGPLLLPGRRRRSR